MKTKIEVIYEKIALEAVSSEEDQLMKELIKSIHLLELDLHTTISDRDEDYPAYLKTDIADVMYYLLAVASKHGACLECLAEIMETKHAYRDGKKKGFTIIMPTPKVTNTDNTGPVIK